jgi:hypothetical protein
MSQETFSRVVGNATFHLMARFATRYSGKNLEIAVGTDNALRHHLAVFLHERHPRTAHSPKPTALA